MKVLPLLVALSAISFYACDGALVGGAPGASAPDPGPGCACANNPFDFCPCEPETDMLSPPLSGDPAEDVEDVEVVEVVEEGPKDDGSSETDSPTTPELRPGPSASLFNSQPYYTCAENRYVATAANGGSDSNDGLAPTVGGGHGPWLTLHHAAASVPDPAPGYCINIGDGTYNIANPINVKRGGDEAAKTGFLVWRAQNLLGAKLASTASTSAVLRVAAPYVIFDGIEIQGAKHGKGIDTCMYTSPNYWDFNGTHHVIALNNYIHDVGKAGISFCWAEYIWVIHNRLDENAYETHSSGVSIYQPMEIPNYKPTPYDERWTPYHNVVAHNRCFGNFTSPEGSPHTDGNGIIYDDTQHTQRAPNVVYKPRALFMGNVTWGNGGAGIQIGPHSANADVFNNTAYNNHLDTLNTGSWRGGISCSIGTGVHHKNNISVAVVGSGKLSKNSPFLGGNPVGTNSWTSNIAYGADPYMNGSDSFPTPANMKATDPLFVNLGANNFALGQGSPAIGAGEQVPHWPQQTAGAIDIGACPAELATCP